MAGVLTSRFDVSNLDIWGRLVKSWATQLDYINVGYDAQPPRTNWVNQTWPEAAAGTREPVTTPTHQNGQPLQPWCLPDMVPVNVPRSGGGDVPLAAIAMTRAEFATKVGQAGVDISNFPAQYENVVVVQGDVPTLVFRLPPKDILQSSEDDLKVLGNYRIRPFYSVDVYQAKPNPPQDDAGIMKLHANRIGEYTMNNCD